MGAVLYCCVYTYEYSEHALSVKVFFMFEGVARRCQELRVETCVRVEDRMFHKATAAVAGTPSAVPHDR